MAGRRQSRRRILEEHLRRTGQLGPVRDLELFVRGRPATKGSFVPFFSRSTGRMLVKGDNPRTLGWQARIAAAAREAGAVAGTGPARVSIAIVLPRPASHLGTGRNAGVVRATAPELPTAKPDVDKVTRAALDALSLVAWLDDSQVVELHVDKNYADEGEEPGVWIEVGPAAGRRAG